MSNGRSYPTASEEELLEKWSKYLPILLGDEGAGLKIMLALEGKRILDDIRGSPTTPTREE